MNIFEKIKKLFKRDNKLLIEASKELEAKKEANFLENVKVKTEDLLNPNLYQGENLIHNILKALGVNDTIVNNEQAVCEIKYHINEMLSEEKLPLLGNKKLEKAEILKILSYIKSRKVLTLEERITKRGTTPKMYYGINVDSKTGNIQLQKFWLGREDAKNKFGEVMQTDFEPDENGNIVKDYTHAKTNLRNLREELIDERKTVFNENAIAIEREMLHYGIQDGENRLTYHDKRIRDEEYPFIMKQNIIVNTDRLDRKPCKRYVDIKWEKLEELDSYLDENDEDSKNIISIFASSNRQDCIANEVNRKRILRIINEGTRTCNTMYSRKWHQLVNKGLKELAQKAGILEQEEQSEK